MARYGTLGDFRFSDMQEAAEDIRGAEVYGPDDHKLGEIDDVVFDESTGAIVYVVVDTGGWLSSRRFVVPPQEIRPSVQHENDFMVTLTKEQIETFPPYDDSALTTEELWADYERRYRSKWADGPIMHREGTDRNVTPTSKQQVQSGSGVIPGSVNDPMPDSELEELEDETEIAAVHPEVEMRTTPNSMSYRWSRFEDTLRRRLDQVVQSSINKAKRADREGMREHRGSQRKVS